MTFENAKSTRDTGDHACQPSQVSVTTPKRVYVATKPQSISPRKRQIKQPLTIRMNLTERQMNKVTEAITQKVNHSPVRAEESFESRSWGPKKDAYLRENGAQQMMSENGSQQQQHADTSPTFSELMSKSTENPANIGSLAGRRNQLLPPPIRTSAQTRYHHVSSSGQESGSVLEDSPERQPSRKHPYGNRCEAEKGAGNSSGLNSSDYKSSERSDDITGDGHQGRQVNEAITDMYNSWANMQSPNARPEYPRRHQSLMRRPRRSKSTVEYVFESNPTSSVSVEAAPIAPPPQLSRNVNAVVESSPQFSPLPLYFRDQSFPSTKRGEKTMIGQNGWLECTGKVFDDGKKPQVKRIGFLNSIKKIAKDVTAELNSSYRRPNPSAPDAANTSQVAISLDAREQSLLYCEVEFHLTSALNDYITSEFDKGHLLPDNLKKISDFWLQQGRPRVISFRYDLETQLELVALHLNEFNFYGRRQSNPVEIMGLLHSMKVNARAMRVRTFCQPDSVITKQLIDSQSLFNLLNVSNAQQLALAEIGQFFRMIVQRERANHGSDGRCGHTTAHDHDRNISWQESSQENMEYHTGRDVKGY